MLDPLWDIALWSNPLTWHCSFYIWFHISKPYFRNGWSIWFKTKGIWISSQWGYYLHPVYFPNYPWWRHQMETFSALLAICARNSPVPGEFPVQRPVTRSFDIFFYLRLNKRLSKQSWGWGFETLSRPLWRHCNVYCICTNCGFTGYYHCAQFQLFIV